MTHSIKPGKTQYTTQNLDHLGLVAATAHRIGLVEKIDKRLPLSKEKGAKLGMGHRVLGMILNALGFMDQRLYLFSEFMHTKPIDRLMGEGVKAEDFTDDALGRALDAISDYGPTQFFTEIAFEIGIENQLLGQSVHIDTTTLGVYGAYESNAIPQNHSQQEEPPKLKNTEKQDPSHQARPEFGFSKSCKPGLKQMVLNLATTGASAFPVWMESLSGNVSDKKSLHAAAVRMKEFCTKLEEAPKFLFVGDSALYDACAQASDFHWLTRVPETHGAAKD
jgi:transposase